MRGEEGPNGQRYEHQVRPTAHFSDPPVTQTHGDTSSSDSMDHSAGLGGSEGSGTVSEYSAASVDTGSDTEVDTGRSTRSDTRPMSSGNGNTSSRSSSTDAQPADPSPSVDRVDSPKREPAACLYVVGRELGQGTYSVVKEARHIETDKWYAAKVINKRLMRGREHLVRNEIVVLKRVSRGHPNILTLVDYFETDNSLYLITELAKGGELFDRLYTRGSFYESDAAKIVKEITSGVAHLHDHGIVHRDLKPENLLFKTQSDRSNLLICDFGLSRIIDEENFHMLTTTVGTPSYMAPEIFTKRGHGKPVDIWAIGIIAYFLLCGYTPFDRDTAAEEREAIIGGIVRFEPQEYWIHVTSDALKFIRACLHVDPSQRPTAHQLMEMPFLTKRYRKEADLLPQVMSNLSVKSQPSDVLGIPSTLDGTAMNGMYSRSPDVEQPKPSIFSAKWG